MPKINEYSKKLTRDLNSLFHWQSNKVANIDKKKEEIKKSKEIESIAFQIPKRYYLPKRSQNSSSKSLHKISSLHRKNCDSVSASLSLKVPRHSQSFGSLPIIEKETIKQNSAINKTPKKQTQLEIKKCPSVIHPLKNSNSSPEEQSSSKNSNSNRSKKCFPSNQIENAKKMFENSPSLGYLEEDLIQEISAINDRIEDLIHNQKPLIPPKAISFKNLQNVIKQQEKTEEIQVVRTPFQKGFYRNESAREKTPPNPLKEDLTRMKVFSRWLDLSVYERNNIWAENKIKRIEEQKSQKRLSCLNECTFRPKISYSNSGVSPEKYGTYDINQMKQIFRETKTYRNTYSNQRKLKKRFNSVNKPLNDQ